jgi:BMFP domain-containing protein YqiC
MATPSCINIDKTTAVVEWQWEDATRTLATADPDHDAIRFTLQLDLSEDNNPSRAHFEISIPFRFKDKPAGGGVCLRINPFFIKSINYSTIPNPSDDVKRIFDSTACLDFELNNRITVLIPSGVKEPIVAARARSGKILDSLHELSRVNYLRVYIEESLLSLDDLKSISETVEQRQVQPSSYPDHDISRMFSGNGGKVATVAPPEPPSYEKATKLPPNPPPNRKRPRQESRPDIFTQFWDKLNKLEAKVGELQADNAYLREENAQLKGKVARLEMRHEGLEAQVALSQGNGHDAEEAAMIEIRDDIDSLNGRVASIEAARDQEFSEQIKDDIIDEIAKRLLGG